MPSLTRRTLTRRTLLAGLRLAGLRLAGLSAGLPLLHAAGKRVVYVLGDHEYSGEQTMPVLAKNLDQRYGTQSTILTAQPDQNAETNLPGLEALANADLAVFFLRWRRLPAEQVAHIDRYVQAGRPVLGIRTSSHSFNYPKDHELAAWNRWASEAFGTPPGWGQDGHTHYGHESTTEVRLDPSHPNHPILTGITGPFHVPSWLYHVLPNWPPPDARRLLIGQAINPNKPAVENPVAWTWQNKYGGRAFYTSLGHPGDFAVPQVQRLFVNAVQWGLNEQAKPKWHGPVEINVPYRGIVNTQQLEKDWPLGKPRPK